MRRGRRGEGVGRRPGVNGESNGDSDRTSGTQDVCLVCITYFKNDLYFGL